MYDNLIKRIELLSEESLSHNPKDFKQFQNFLLMWYCDRYKIPVTSDQANAIEFETLLLEYMLVTRWKKIEDGTLEKEEQIEKDEEWLKQEMGDEYHDDTDYYDEPPKSAQADDMPDIEDKFDLASIGE